MKFYQIGGNFRLHELLFLPAQLAFQVLFLDHQTNLLVSFLLDGFQILFPKMQAICLE